MGGRGDFTGVEDPGGSSSRFVPLMAHATSDNRSESTPQEARLPELRVLEFSQPEAAGELPTRAEFPNAGELPAGSGPGRDFVELFTRNQRRIYLYILALVPSPLDAEEVLQETNLVIWSKFAQFAAGSSFGAWACQIAYFEILKFRDRKRRDKHQLSLEFVELVQQEATARADLLERRRAALVHCLTKLKERDRQLIQQRYSAGASGESVSELLGRPINSIYQSLGRIRKTLLECVNRQLAAERNA